MSLLWRPVVALTLAAPALGFSFNIVSNPRQCQDFNLEITNPGDSKPPYSVLIVPWGPSKVAKEVRKVTNKQFSGTSTTVRMDYPTNSEFVMVVSDSTEFGNGGTTAPATVLGSDNTSCFDVNAPSTIQFVWSIQPANSLIQCSPTRIYWDPTKTEGTPTFHGVIPQGQSRTIPVGTLTDESFNGFGAQGFSFTPSVLVGTNYILVGGDGRGVDSGGSQLFPILPGFNPDSSCVNSTSPSATPAPAAGGSYPTSTQDPGIGGGKKTNIGAIVGGVIGAIVGLIIFLLVALFLYRRNRDKKSGKDRPVDLLQGDDPPARDDLPQYYVPEPFMVPDPTETGSQYPMSESNHRYSGPSERPHSTYTTTTDMRSATPDGAPGAPGSVATTRKSAGGPRAFRAVNLVQHEDAGPSASSGTEEPETVELPPAYTNIRK